RSATSASARPAKHLFEDVKTTSTTRGAEVTEVKITKVEPARARSCSSRRSLRSFPSRRWRACARFDCAPVVAVLVIKLSILRVGKYVISLLQSFELFFGILVTGVQVRVKFARQFSISLLDLILRRVPLYAEDLVVIFRFRSHR